MFVREGFVVLTKAQVRELLAEVEAAHRAAFEEGYLAAEEEYEHAFDAGYNEGYADATDEYGDDYDDGYAEGHEAGYLSAAEDAAFSETPKIHSWVEGEQIG